MSKVLDNLRYTESHEWLKKLPDDASDKSGVVYVLGITDYAQEHLGDLVFVELPKVGVSVEKEKEVAVVESVKSASDIYSPIEGKVVAINEALSDNPELISKDPYGEGWIVQIKADSGVADPDGLLGADEYAKLVDEK